MFIVNMDFDTFRPLEIVIRGLHYLGLWKGMEGTAHKFYTLRTTLTYIIVTATVVSLGINLMYMDNLEDLIEFLCIFLTEVADYVKLNSLIFNIKHYIKYISVVKDEDFRPKSNLELKYYTNKYHYFMIFLKGFLTTSTVALSLYTSTAIFASEYTLPYPFWFPFDWKCKENYWYACISCICGLTVACFVCLFLDLFHSFVLCHLVVVYKLLNYRLECLGGKVEISSDAVFEDLREIMVLHMKVEKLSSEICLEFSFCQNLFISQDSQGLCKVFIYSFVDSNIINSFDSFLCRIST